MTAHEGPKIAPYELPKVHAEYQELLNLQVRRVENLFAVGEDGDTAVAPTGEFYLSYSTDGPRDKGSCGQYFDTLEHRWRSGATIHLDPDTAIYAFTGMMEKLRKEMRGKPTLYWRTRPELGHFYREIKCTDGMVYRLPVWDVYARFLVTHQPPLED